MPTRLPSSIIWDFNGTLIDDLDLVVQAVNRQLQKRGLPALDAAAYRDVFGFPVEAYYRRLGLTFENETMAELSADFFAFYGPRLRDCRLHAGVRPGLARLALLGVRQFVLSAMEQGMLQSMIDHLGIRACFQGVYGLAHQEGDSKVARGRDLLYDFSIDPSSALLIGDTDHDAEVARALGIPAALVSTGHQSERVLLETGVAVHPSVLTLIETIAKPGADR